MAPKTRPAPTTKKPNKRPPAQKAKESVERDVITTVFKRARGEAIDAYRPTRLEYFAAVALEGILAAPHDTITEKGGKSVSKNAVLFAKAVIAEIDEETEKPRAKFYTNVPRR